MKKPALTSAFVTDLAERVERDIRVRGLREGDPYYTTTEVGDVFGVSRETARKVMELLAKRHLVERHRRRGTFVGAGSDLTAPIGRREVILIVEPHPPSWPPSPLFLFPQFLDQAMPACDIRCHILPVDREVQSIRALIEPVRNAGLLDGVVTTARTREVYEYLLALDVPVVLLGTLDSGMPNLPTVDLDFYEAGRLLVEYVARRGHQHIIAQLSSDYGGDHRFIDGIVDALSAAQLPPNALKFRVFNGDPATTRAHCRDCFNTAPDHPTAVIAKSHMLAEIAAAAARDEGLEVGRDVEITWSANAMRMEYDSPYVHALPTSGMEDLAARVAKMLADQREGRPLEERNVLLPTELRIPPQGGSKKRGQSASRLRR